MSLHRRPSDASSTASQPSRPPSPPSYPTEPVALPTYHVRPDANEDTLLAGAVPPPVGVYTKKTKHVVLALLNQETSLEVGEQDNPDKRPVYGKGATIAGAIELKEDAGLKLADVLKIQGKLKLELIEGGSSTQLFLDHSATLYPLPSQQSRSCPSLLSFSYTLPLTFDELSPPNPADPSSRDPVPVQRLLPPTFSTRYDGVPGGMRADIKYSIKIIIERKRWWGLGKAQTLRVPFNYVPRTRPHIPGPPGTASFLSALKQTPEEWTVFVNELPRRSTPLNSPTQHTKDIHLNNGETLSSSLVIPSVQTFPVNQAIPFHLQLSLASQRPLRPSVSTEFPSSKPKSPPARSRRPRTAPHPSLTIAPTPPSSPPSSLLSLFTTPEFGPPPQRGRKKVGTTAVVGLAEGMAADGAMFGDPRYANTGRSVAKSKPLPSHERQRIEDEHDKSYIRVFLQRQIVVTVKGQKVVRTIPCGEGKLHRVRLEDPPAFSSENLPLLGSSARHHDDQLESPVDRSFSPVQSPYASNQLSCTGIGKAVQGRHFKVPGADGIDCIAWEGYVLPCREAITVGGFRTSGLWVKDFITLTMIPPDPDRSPLRTLHHAVPIRLVSDPWEEEWWAGRRN
ncbi:hypothetical protein FRB99_004954 [Tulasnella sp. 403]|nr:hypothetical protein FRB99_004954 [Tulasnella sp. 403]